MELNICKQISLLDTLSRISRKAKRKNVRSHQHRNCPNLKMRKENKEREKKNNLSMKHARLYGCLNIFRAKFHRVQVPFLFHNEVLVPVTSLQ